MPFSSGTFSPYTPGNPVVTGTTISSTVQNNTINDIATGLTTCILKDGTQTVTANIPFAGFKLTGVGAGTIAGDAVNYTQLTGSGGSALVGFLQAGAGAVARTMQAKERDVVSVKDFGATGDNATNDAAAIQAAIDSLSATGGVVYLPRGKYFIGTTTLNILYAHTQLIGDGGDFDETGATDAPTLIRYTGLTDAIVLGTSSMTAVLHGIVIKDLEIRGTSNAVGAGIHLEYNGAGFFPGRCLIENVSVKGFTNAAGAGIQVDFAVSLTLRRTNTSENLNGINIDGGTALYLNNIIARSNTSTGVKVKFANGLLLDGFSVLESNAHAGFLLTGIDNSRNIYILGNHFEENNTSNSSTNYQIYFTGSGAIRATNVVIDGNEFSSSGLASQDGDIFLDFIGSSTVNNIWTDRTAAEPVLKYGTTVALSRFGQQIIIPSGSSATIDPDVRGIEEQIIKGSFTATLTGCTTAPTYTVLYQRHGRVVTLQIPLATATSNATTKTLTGLPAVLTPGSGTIYQVCAMQDNTGAFAAGLITPTSSSTLSLSPDLALSAWTAGGTFTMRAQHLVYILP